MDKPGLLNKLLILFLLLGHQSELMAQIIPDIIYDARQDGQKIFRAYMTPLLERAGPALNRNWSSSAQLKEKFSFNFAFKYSTISADEHSRTYDLDRLELAVLRPVPGSGTIASTIMGDILHHPILEVWKRESSYTSYNPYSGSNEVIYDPARAIQDVSKLAIPKGSPSKWINGNQISLVPFLQIDAGLPFHSEISIRFSPTIAVEDITYRTIGAGIKHDLMQWLVKDFSGNSPDKTRPFDLSLQFGYTQVKANYKSPDIILGIQQDNGLSNNFADTQSVLTMISGLNTEVLLSKMYMNWLSPMVAVGLSRSRAEVRILGKYPIQGLPAGSQTPTSTEKLSAAHITVDQNRYVFVDPIKVKLKQTEFKVSIGVQAIVSNLLSLGALATWGKFNSYSVSISLMTDSLF